MTERVLPPQRADPRRHQCCGQNPVLTRTYSQINARLQALRFRSNQEERKWSGRQEHSQMIDALAARDAAGLRQLLITHLHHKRDVVLEMMRAGTLTMRSKA
jgi:DNA-binding GntR family transcriptional regulator